MAERWGFVLPGQPPSVNHLYEPAWKTDREGRSYKGKKIMDEALAYRDGAIYIIREARPSRWKPDTDLIRVYWAFYLNHNVDCDNAMKVIHDALKVVIQVDDARFLPCVMTKVLQVPKLEARVEIIVDEARGSLWSDLGRWPDIQTP